MNRDQARQIFEQQFFRSLGESGISLSALPPEQLKVLTTATSDAVFAILAETLNTLDQAGNPPAGAPPAGADASPDDGDAHHEKILWEGRPYLSIGTKYVLTSTRLRIFRGILSHNLEEIELIRIRDTKVQQNTGERMVNIGDIILYSNDPTTPEFELSNVHNPLEVRELMRKAILDEKERRRFGYREEL